MKLRIKMIWLANLGLFLSCILLGIMGHCAELEWTRLKGQVKGVNLKAQTVTLQNGDGDLLVVPVDYQVKIVEKHGELRTLKDLQLDEKVILTRTPMEKPKDDDMTGMAPPEREPKGK